MGIIGSLIILFLASLLIGGLARFLLPGPDPMPLGETALLGFAGSLIAALVSRIATGSYIAAGLPLSVIASMGLVYLRRRSRGLSTY
ncbi:MAG TPA: hypothetical protein VHX88_21015 [Solirubrobacteraceae bacterium]|jgi:uncharacterized membrane protein YeaQ/YmgE (transglycosylase-associated protein family)|nr:hypothetical protein [Solirubrobacteraceae bacterium]